MSNHLSETSDTPFSVVIIGAPTSSGNRGVLALASGLVNLFANGRPNVEATLLVGSPSPAPLNTVIDGLRVKIKAINYRHTFKSGLVTCLPWIFAMSLLYRLLPIQAWRRYLARKIPWIGCLASCDIVGDIRGGDSFSDIYGMQRYFFGFLCAWTAILVHGSIVQYPQTYGPYNSGLARAMARFLLKRSSHIIARDTKSQKVAQELVGPDTEILLSPDVAFALEVLRPPLPREPSNPLIGINVNGLMYNGGYDRKNQFGLSLQYPDFLDGLVRELLATGTEDIWLVPHTYAPSGDVESDNEACQRLKDRLPVELHSRIQVIDTEYDQHEIKGIIARCDGFLGSRMHSCIAALSQGIPCVGIAYSMKFLGVFESVGMGDWVVDARDETTSTAISKSVALLRSRDARREALKAASEAARLRLKLVFAGIIKDASNKI